MDTQESKRTPDSDLQSLDLSEGQRLFLLGLARSAIDNAVSNRVPAVDEAFEDHLQQPAAVFVTLWQRELSASSSDDVQTKGLRGCIGRVHPDYPLYSAVQNAAVSAATRDPRFPAVQPGELDTLIIEISILSPLQEVKSLQEIVIGRDGLVIEANGRRGLLLPKVATRLNWGRAEFVQNVCRKAGVPHDIWPQNGRLHRFSTLEFHE